jgi:hypothetical protein
VEKDVTVTKTDATEVLVTVDVAVKSYSRVVV